MCWLRSEAFIEHVLVRFKQRLRNRSYVLSCIVNPRRPERALHCLMHRFGSVRIVHFKRDICNGSYVLANVYAFWSLVAIPQFLSYAAEA